MRRKYRVALLLFVQTLVDKGGHYPDLGELLREVLCAFWACNEVEEENVILWYASGLEHVNGHERRTTWLDQYSFLRSSHISLTSSQHRIQQQNPPFADILGQFVIIELWFGSLLVSLDQDLADTDTPTAVPKPLFHRLSRSHDGHAADLAFKLDTRIGVAYRRGDLLGFDGKVVKAFFDEETDDSVAVEDEVCTAGGTVAYHALRQSALYDVRMIQDGIKVGHGSWSPYVSSAIS